MKLLNTKTFTLLLSAAAVLLMTGCSGDGENGAASEKNLLTEVQPSVGQPPVAVAGADRTVVKGDIVTLDGSQSNDPDGQIVLYEWSASGITKTGSTITVDTSGLALGTITVTLTVTDDEGNTDSDTVEVTLIDGATNLPPDAIISQPKVDDTYNCDGYGYGDDPVTSIILDGSTSTDPDGDPLSFAWSGTSKGEQLKGLIVDKDVAKTSIPLGSLDDEESLCGVVSENCNSTDDSSGRCIVIFNLDVSDGKVSDNAQVTVYLQLPV